MTQPAASEAMYPSLLEMLEASPNPLSAYLIEELRRRYDAHGWEYDSGEGREDGRAINTCMAADSRQLAREELVDAVWNILVLNLKERSDWKILATLESCLTALTHLQ